MSDERSTANATRPLLGPAYNGIQGPYPVPLSERGKAAREQVLERIKSGAYQLEELPCLCGGTREELICTMDRYFIPHRTVLCVKCGLVRTNPRWTEKTYRDFYTHYYRALYERPGHTAANMFAVQRPGSLRRARYVLSKVAQDRKLSVAEIGCGGGWNLLPFHQRGDATVGFDYDEGYLAAGRSQGLDLRAGGLEMALAGGKRYDVVILSHVVEHFMAPVADLQKIQRLLANDGLLFIEVPNLFAVTRNLLRYWQSAHTYSFVPATLRQLLQRSGYEEVAMDDAIASLWRVNLTATRLTKVDPGLARKTRRFLKNCESDALLHVLQRKLKVKMARLWVSGFGG